MTTQRAPASVLFRLQRVVEGLSVIATTYYLLGLVAHGLHGVEALDVNTDAAVAIALPIVAGLVWFILRRARRYLAADKDE